MDLKEQYFGTEIEMTGITREEAANAVGELFGTQPYYIGTYYSTWGVRDLEGKEWKFTYDGSIHTQRRNGNRYVYADSEYSTEMVSPKLEYGEMEKLQQVVRCLRSMGESQFLLWNACSCGCLQSYTTKFKECSHDHVFQRRYFI